MRNTAVAIALIAALAGAASLAAADANSVLLRGGTVHPVSGPEIANGSVLVVDGKIAGVGANIAAPKGVRVLNVRGLHVYPGMIDSATQLGLTEIGAVDMTNDTSDIGDFNPQLRAVIAVNPASEHIPVTRANGITAAIAAPEGSLISGQAALIRLDGWTWEQMAAAPSAAMMLTFPTIQTRRSYRQRGATPFEEAKKEYDKKVQRLHEYFEEARRYQRAKAAGAPGLAADVRYEAMLPVLEGRQPLVIRAVRERAIRDALKFAEKQPKVRVVIAGAMEAYKAIPELKAAGVPVILGPTLELPLEEDDAYDRMYTAPAELHKAGIRFAFGSFSASFSRNLPYQAANAVAYGLPYEDALKAVTLTAAEIWGVADRMGSIAEGKSADLIVTDGDPLETRTHIRHEFIAGREVDLSNKHLRLYEQYMSRP